MENKNNNKMGLTLLKYFCDANYGQIAEMFNSTIDSKGNIFVDNDSNILAIAHMDVTGAALANIKHKRPQRFELMQDKNTLYSPCLDDRLGIYAIYLLWKKYNLKFDILLTIDEEKCNSTAQFFKTNKQYNWMFQFDRAGNNHVVMYNYENENSKALLKTVGLKLNVGSYSDICELEHLKCIGFNFAIGYYNQHTYNCYMKINEYKNQVIKFKKFYELYKNVPMVYEPKNISFSLYKHSQKQMLINPTIETFCNNENYYHFNKNLYYQQYWVNETPRIKPLKKLHHLFLSFKKTK